MVQIPSQERELMATVYLKEGTKVEVPISELGEYLETYRDLIQVQKLKSRRGPVRVKAIQR
jgi:cell division septal protein FtsQ